MMATTLSLEEHTYVDLKLTRSREHNTCMRAVAHLEKKINYGQFLYY